MRYWKRKLKGRPAKDKHANKNYFAVLWEDLLSLLFAQKKLNTIIVCLDGTLIPSFEFKERTGYSGKHHKVGVKASVLTEATGIPLGVTIDRGFVNDVSLAIDTIENIRTDESLYESTFLADKGIMYPGNWASE